MRSSTILAVAVCLAFGSGRVAGAVPMGMAFTYQGRLIDANSTADGLYDFQFKLYDASDDGSQIGSTIDVNECDVIDGYLTIALDFGSSVFNGDDRWLEIGVRPGDLSDPNEYTILSPRQNVTPTPYALHTQGIFLDADKTLVGLEAGAVNSGVYNTFLGYRAGYSNTTGTWNTFSGNWAGHSNTTGYYNTFSGASAGYSNTTGHYNTFSGCGTGQANTTGYYNTFSGYETGYLNTTGNSNTFLGMRAGYYNDTGSGNVFIGYKAGSNERGSNKLYVANGPADANVLIYGDFSTRRLGIRTTNPTESLDVFGNIRMSDNTSGFIMWDGWTNRWAFRTASTSPSSSVLYIGGGFHTVSIGAKVGIGTTSPAENLEIAGNVKMTGTGNGLIFPDGTKQTTAGSGGQDSDWTISGTNMYSGVSGNVGIGTSAPAYKLDVSGDIRATGTIYGTISGTISDADKVDGYHVSDLDGRYVNEGQSNSINSAMIQNSTIQFADLGQNGAASGQVVKWNGSAWAAAPDLTGGGGGLDLPYAGTWPTAGSAFSVTNTGSGQGVEGRHSQSGNYGYLGGNDYAVYAYSPKFGGHGVYSLATNIPGTAIYGYANNAGDGVNFGGYFWARGTQGRGISAKASNMGDVTNYGGYFTALGTYGRGIYAETQGAQGYAAEFKGNVLIRSRTSGTTVMELGEGLDYAEGFDVSDSNKIEPGSILIIDTDNPGKLVLQRYLDFAGRHNLLLHKQLR